MHANTASWRGFNPRLRRGIPSGRRWAGGGGGFKKPRAKGKFAWEEVAMIGDVRSALFLGIGSALVAMGKIF